MSKSNKPIEPLSKKRVGEIAIVVLIFFVMAFMLVTFYEREFSYKQLNTENISYVRGVVRELVVDELNEQPQFTAGYQKIKVELLGGKAKGEIVEIENYITAIHNVPVKEGSRVIIRTDMPEGITPYFSLYNYDRTFGSLGMILFFFAIVVLVGGKRGFMSCVGLMFTLCTVVCFMLPNIFEGGNVSVISVVTIVLSTAVSCFCVGGLTKKTYLNILSTVLGTITAGLVYALFVVFLKVSGTNIAEVEELSLISNYTGLNLNGILFAGILISSLGAVMDVAVSMGASLNEIKEINPKISPKNLFRSGMNIGKDMIGTMTNTLILAFAGGTLSTLIIFLSLGLEFHQFVSSNFFALELASGISGSTAVVLTVPISAAICSFTKINNKNNKKIKQGDKL